jgi:ribosomal-protein-alanine N-acetyltransferase
MVAPVGDVMEIRRLPTTFPPLETKRLVLREVTPDDADAMFAVRSHPDVMRYWGERPWESREQALAKIVELQQTFRNGNAIRWGLALKENGRLVGSAGFWYWQKEHFRAEIGYELHPDEWGKGYMAEALAVIVRFGFEDMGLHSIQANVDPQNKASARVLEKVGFAREGWLLENFYFDGRFYDTWIFGLRA